jgi:hypothetical protein
MFRVGVQQPLFTFCGAGARLSAFLLHPQCPCLARSSITVNTALILITPFAHLVECAFLCLLFFTHVRLVGHVIQMDILSSYGQITWPSGQNFTQKKARIRPEVQHSAVLKAVIGMDETRALKMV